MISQSDRLIQLQPATNCLQCHILDSKQLSKGGTAVSLLIVQHVFNAESKNHCFTWALWCSQGVHFTSGDVQSKNRGRYSKTRIISSYFISWFHTPSYNPNTATLLQYLFQISTTVSALKVRNIHLPNTAAPHELHEQLPSLIDTEEWFQQYKVTQQLHASMPHLYS